MSMSKAPSSSSSSPRGLGSVGGELSVERWTTSAHDLGPLVAAESPAAAALGKLPTLGHDWRLTSLNPSPSAALACRWADSAPLGEGRAGGVDVEEAAVP